MCWSVSRPRLLPIEVPPTLPCELGFLHSPRRGPGVCVECFNLTREFRLCFACSSTEQHLAAMVPVSYSIAHEYLHHTLASYKRLQGLQAERAARDISAILWRFLVGHETCLAAEAGVARFDLVTTVPSGDVGRDEHHPLRYVVGELVGHTRGRHERLLRRSNVQVMPRRFDARRFQAVGKLNGESVLLIDDTWTTGASAQSAASALKAAGAGAVAAVVVGRHVNREWHQNDRKLDALTFDWSECGLCAPARLRNAA